MLNASATGASDGGIAMVLVMSRFFVAVVVIWMQGLKR